jgi:putative two-component system response regulator
MERCKLLLIDDDAAVLQLLAARLARRYEVLTSTQPLSAIAVARSEQPDAILCDLDMPVMSGHEVAAALSADPATAAIPLMYLTALVSPDEARDLDGVIDGHRAVSKQAPLEDLVQALVECGAGARLLHPTKQ